MPRCSLQQLWNDGDPTPMSGKLWENPFHKDENGNPQPTTMTPEEIAAVKVLGHTVETWNFGMTQDEAASKICGAFKMRKTRQAYLQVVKERVGGAL